MLDFKELSKKVTKEELKDIIHAFMREDELDSLEAGGVDNWMCYSEALSEFDEAEWDKELSKINSYYTSEVE